MREFDTWRDPYGNGYSTCKPKKIIIEEGLTILVGCNGSGKSTLLHNVEVELKQSKIPVVLFDDLHKRGSNSIGSAMFNNDIALTAAFATSSEGETINIRLGQFSANLRKFIDTGKYVEDNRESRIMQAFLDAADLTPEDASIESDERWILMDAVDSGYSVDNIVELKELFNLMETDAASQGVHLYIVVAANEYELARNESCFDVQLGKYTSFSNYEEYRSLILKTRKLKDQRIDRARQNREIKGWKSHHGE